MGLVAYDCLVTASLGAVAATQTNEYWCQSPQRAN